MEIPAIEVSVLLVVLLVTLLVLSRVFRSREPVGRRLPPSFPSIPIIGSLPFLGDGKRIYHYFMERTSDLGDVYTFYGGKRLVLVLNGYEAITDALVKRAVDYADRSPLWTEEHAVNTQLRGITFKRYNESFRKLHAVVSSQLGLSADGEDSLLINSIRKGTEYAVKEIQARNGEPFDPKTLLTELSGRIVLGVLFGERFFEEGCSRVVSAIIADSSAYLDQIDPVIDMLPWVRYLPNFRRKIKAMADIRDALLSRYEEELKLSLGEKSGDSFVRRLAEDSPEVDRQDLIYIIRDLVFGGTDTISTTLLWALVLLANHQDVQRRLRKEIGSVVSSERLPTEKDRHRLPYAEAVLLEILRSKGVTPFSSARSTTCDTNVKEYFVPAGCMVLVNLYSVHMNPADWKDPEVFRPERFLDDEGKIIKKDRVIPFNLGVRACTGEHMARLELFLLLCSLVQRFDIQPPIGMESIPEEEVYKIVLAPLPFQIRLIPQT